MSRPAARPAAADGGSGAALIPLSEVARHDSPGDLWVVVNGRVLDLTAYAAAHPGGSAVLHAWAGRDASALFNAIHSPGIVDERLLAAQPGALVGAVDPDTLPTPPTPIPSPSAAPSTNASASPSASASAKPIELEDIIGLPDLDAAAEQRLSAKGWAYISAGATDEVSLAANRAMFAQVWFRPRVLRDVGAVDTRTTLLGCPSAVPFFIAPTGMSALAGRAGEPGLAAAAGRAGVVQFVSTNSSAPLGAVLGARSAPDQAQFFQLYVDRERGNSAALLRAADAHPGVRAVFVTVDCAAPGKREADERVRADAVAAASLTSGTSGGVVRADARGAGVGRTTGQYIDPGLSWADLAWVRAHTRLPLGVKGVQSVEDAVACADAGVDAIYLSNHGGRALDGAPPALLTLLELRRLRPDVLDRCEVYVDGGVRRGTDVVKALCLGARAVGLGRPFLYALSYGEAGVDRAIDILADEVRTTMRLLGVTSLDQLGPHLLNTRALDPLCATEIHLEPLPHADAGTQTKTQPGSNAGATK